MARPDGAPRPFVTLAYAQSIDGSIAAQPGQPLALSGSESLRLTHQLRSTHDAILVGIGTVLADDPQLNVRLVQGTHPRPIILDSRLRCPPIARCIDAVRNTLIIATDSAPMANQQALEAVGASVVRLPATQDKIDLPVLLNYLATQNIRTLMVEGGATIITSFLRARLVDRVIVTLAPLYVGGVRSVNALISDTEIFPRLRHTTMQQIGEDWILSGEIDWMN